MLFLEGKALARRQNKLLDLLSKREFWMDSLNCRCLSPSYPHNPSLEESRTNGCIPEWVGSFCSCLDWLWPDTAVAIKKRMLACDGGCVSGSLSGSDHVYGVVNLCWSFTSLPVFYVSTVLNGCWIQLFQKKLNRWNTKHCKLDSSFSNAGEIKKQALSVAAC